MRSALVSPVPISMVEVDSTPSVWASSMISSQRSPDSFSGAMALRGRSGSSSAPAPAKESRPAAWIRRIASSALTPEIRAMCSTSDAPREWMTSCGNSFLIAAKCSS